MTLFQFASYNVRRNTRTYMAYFLSSAFSIMMFFLYATLANHPALQQRDISGVVMNGMIIGECMIFGFAFFSILYSMGSFLKGRTREFGILTILGMTGCQFVWMVFLENMLLGLAAVGAAIVMGLIGSKLFLLLGSALFYTGPLNFYLPKQALFVTSVAFSALFFIVSLATTLFIRKNTVLTLLKGVARPKKEPKASIWLALLAAVCLIGGYAIALSPVTHKEEGSIGLLLLIVVLVTLGTYFLYSQLSVVIIRGLKKIRAFYWRGTRMLWLSELAYSMKDNARLFFVISMILSVSFISTSMLAIVEATFGHPTFPFAFTIVLAPSNNAAVAPIETLMTKSLHDQHIKYTVAQGLYARLAVADHPSDDPAFMSVSAYNRLAATAQIAPLAVKPGEAVEVSDLQQDNAPFANGSIITVLNKTHQQVHVINNHRQQVFNSRTSIVYALIVPDQDYQRYTAGVQQNLYLGYASPDWQDTLRLSQTLQDQTLTIYQKYNAPSSNSYFNLESHATDYFGPYQILNVLMFVGLFVAVIFLIASSSFLYFKLYSSLAENKRRYRSLIKVGLTLKEMRSSITIQIAFLFFVPFIMAILHTFFAMCALQGSIQLGSPLVLLSLAVSGGFFLIQLVYFIMVRSQYLRQLELAVSLNS